MELNLDITKRYSFADYLTWMDDKRRELYNGFVKMMTPVPRRIHQEISGNLSFLFKSYLKKKKCKIYTAPFDVRLPVNGEKADDKILTVVQPDICIICDLSKLDDKGCIGAPDMIIEIVSESNSKNDVVDKFLIYEKFGVKEYWIVFPYERTVNVFFLNQSGKYELTGMFAEDSKIPVQIFGGDLTLDLKEIFEE
ncbi:MAG: Uma2 family endonuclease [Bacteroidales bacterium]